MTCKYNCIFVLTAVLYSCAANPVQNVTKTEIGVQLTKMVNKLLCSSMECEPQNEANSVLNLVQAGNISNSSPPEPAPKDPIADFAQGVSQIFVDLLEKMMTSVNKIQQMAHGF